MKLYEVEQPELDVKQYYRWLNLRQPDLNFLLNPLIKIVHNFLSFEKFQEKSLSVT